MLAGICFILPFGRFLTATISNSKSDHQKEEEKKSDENQKLNLVTDLLQLFMHDFPRLACNAKFFMVSDFKISVVEL